MTTVSRNISSPFHRTRRPSVLLTIVAGLILGSLVDGAATVEESFDYAAGGLAVGTAATGIGLSGNWTGAVGGTIVTGLTYTGLPVANNALMSAGSRQSVNFASPLSSGTIWIGFLYQTSPGNPGANTNGVYFPSGNATSLYFGFGLAPYSGTQGELGLGSMTTAGTTAVAANSLQLVGLGTYGSTYLVVLKIEFDTSGSDDAVTVFLNPATNQAEPGVTAAGSYAAYDVGTLSGIGLNVRGAGAITVDEIRVGDTYSDAVGFINVPPDAPSKPAVTAGDNAVTLSWTAPVGKPTGYSIMRSTTSGSGYETIGTTTAPTTNFTDSVLGGQIYYYVITAVNAAGESSTSPPASAEPILAPPAEPIGLSATAGDAQVALSWTGSPFATGYIVKIAIAAEGPYTTVGSTIAPSVSYTHSDGLTNGTTYYYVVSATGVGGEGIDSSPLEATPMAPPPLVGTIEPGVGVRWFAENGVTYQVQWASEDLGEDTVWHDLGNKISGDGTTKIVSETLGPPHNFYRVLSFQ